MITNVLFVFHKLSLKKGLMKTDFQCAVINLCKGFGVPLLQFLTVVDFIQQTTESSDIIVL